MSETDRLNLLRQASWEQRESVELGHAAGSRVFWCGSEEGVDILVGHDDETWDFAVTVQPDIGDAILRAIDDEVEQAVG